MASRPQNKYELNKRYFITTRIKKKSYFASLFESDKVFPVLTSDSRLTEQMALDSLKQKLEKEAEHHRGLADALMAMQERLG